MKLIGLSGKAGSGKDFIYDVLDALHGAERIAFADGVKLDIEETLGLTPYETNLREKPYPPEVRQLLQWWGTDLRRAQDPEYWVKKGVEAIEEAATYASLIVVTDVRFANEAEVIRDLGGIVIEVYADEAVRKQRLGELPPAHASEVMDFRPDGAIINNRTPGFPVVLNEYLNCEPSYSPSAEFIASMEKH